jgi:hypothetical protein
MSRTILLISSLALAVVLLGCSKTETANDNKTTSNEKSTSASTPATTTASSSGEKIGIPECDEYIAKYESCTPKVPEPGRAAYKSALEQTRASWKRLAENPQTKASLAAACKQATETQAAAWKMYGCAN